MLERGCFACIGIDERLSWIGKPPPGNGPDYYLLPVVDRERFCITGVRAPPG